MGDFIHFIIQRQDIVQNLSSQISRLKIYIKNYLNIVENVLILPSPKIPHVAKCANSPNLYATNIFQSLFFLITCACYYFLFPKEKYFTLYFAKKSHENYEKCFSFYVKCLKFLCFLSKVLWFQENV